MRWVKRELQFQARTCKWQHAAASATEGYEAALLELYDIAGTESIAALLHDPETRERMWAAMKVWTRETRLPS